jgi:hypothetical protein
VVLIVTEGINILPSAMVETALLTQGVTQAVSLAHLIILTQLYCFLMLILIILFALIHHFTH